VLQAWFEGMQVRGTPELAAFNCIRCATSSTRFAPGTAGEVAGAWPSVSRESTPSTAGLSRGLVTAPKRRTWPRRLSHSTSCAPQWRESLRVDLNTSLLDRSLLARQAPLHATLAEHNLRVGGCGGSDRPSGSSHLPYAPSLPLECRPTAGSALA
jgi:hypothetical protein